MKNAQHWFGPITVSLAAACLLLGGAATAVSPSLHGVWGSALYRVDLTITNGAVSGTFTQVENPQAPPGKITGQVQPGGQAFTAVWAFPVGPYEASFSTHLRLAGRGMLLSGYRWTDETDPTAFGLHRAVNGQVPATVDESGTNGTGPTGTNNGTTGNGNTGNGDTNVTPTAKLEVTVCERATDGQPQNVATEFTTPKSVGAFVRYTSLPANSNVQWVWTRDGQQVAQLTKTLDGTGWHYHGLQSQTAVTPGSYEVTISLNGQVVARRSLTVRGPATTAPPETTAPTNPNAPGLEIIVCEGAPNGEPQNPSTVFLKPKSLVCLVRHTNLPTNSAVVWVWTRGGERISRHEKALSGTGWAWHGLSSATSMTPGAYTVKIVVNGQEVTTTKITVR
jgi:hypothetical protein